MTTNEMITNTTITTTNEMITIIIIKITMITMIIIIEDALDVDDAQTASRNMCIYIYIYI